MSEDKRKYSKKYIELLDVLGDLYESAAAEFDPCTSSIGFSEALLNTEKILGIDEKDSIIF